MNSASRHWSVLREAWRQRKDVDRVRKPTKEHEFLPAALEITETPPSPGLRLLLLSLCALFTIAIGWSVLGKVDVVAVASGRTMPAANVKVVQPMEIATIRAIHVRNGQRVRRGDVLVELDPTMTAADETQAVQGLMAARIGEARNAALLAHLAGRPARFQAPPGTPADVVATQNELVRSKIAEYETQRTSLVQSRAQRIAELNATRAELAKLRGTLPLLEEQIAARRELVGRGHFPRLRQLEYEQMRIEHVQNIAIQESNAQRAEAGIRTIDADIATLRARLAEEAATELSSSEAESGLRTEELRKSERRSALQLLRAPADGIVQELTIHTVGGVVQPAQPLMVIVPADGEVEVEAKILNRDIGFVHEGQSVAVKLEAFPFTDYGLIEGTVETISRDAVQDEQLGLVYNARVRLASNHIVISDRQQPIGPGLAVQAEIRTGSRRIIEYLLSPISQRVNEAGRER